MTYQASIRRDDPAFRANPGVEASDWAWVAAIVGTIALTLLVNPVGFRGGGSDDFQYLQAARCWVAHGPCLPLDHWQGRWPIVGPLAASIALFGESRLSVGLPSLLCAVGCLALLASLGNGLFGRPIGYLAALFLATSPPLGIDLLDPNIDSAELLFLLASASCAASFAKKRHLATAFGTGLFWSLAFQARETAVVGLIPLALFAWRYARRDGLALALAALGAALPLLSELLTFWAQTGDPLWRRHLSIGHTRIASSELIGVDTSQSPFFNRGYIGHWRHEPGIHLHWALDGLVNLALNLKAGVILPLALVVAPSAWHLLPQRDRRQLLLCALLGLAWACGLIFMLAIDPKPRMMLVPLLTAAIALAVAVRALHRRGLRLLAWAICAVTCLVGLAPTLTHPRIDRAEPATRRWTRALPGQIETDATGLAHLALDPAKAGFAAEGSGRPYLLLRLEPDCGSLSPQRSAGLRLVDQVSLDNFGRDGRGAFCLFRRSGRG